MADFVFNIAKGAVAEKVREGAQLIIVLLKEAETDDSLKDYENLSDLLLASSTEADFTNYERKTISPASVTLTKDDTNDRVDIDIPDQTWLTAGGAINNDLKKLLICEDAASDGTRVPLVAYDFDLGTDGSDLTAQFNAAGFYRAI